MLVNGCHLSGEANARCLQGLRGGVCEVEDGARRLKQRASLGCAAVALLYFGKWD